MPTRSETDIFRESDAGQEALDRLKSRRKEAGDFALRQSLTGAAETTPELAAKDQEMARKTGLSPMMVEQQRELVDRTTKLNDIQAQVADSPSVKSSLMDPAFARSAA